MHRGQPGSFGNDEPQPRARSLIGSRRDVPNFIPRPRGLHKLTYRRLLRAMRGMLNQLDRLPNRRLHPLVRRRLQTEFANRLGRIRRLLGLPVGRPRPQTWYRTTDAACLIGVSRKTLLRWVAAGRVRCERVDTYKRPRYFHRQELARVIASLMPGPHDAAYGPGAPIDAWLIPPDKSAPARGGQTETAHAFVRAL